MDGERRRSSLYDGDREDAPRNGRRSRWVLLVALLAAVAIAGGAAVLLATTDDDPPREAAPDESVPGSDPPEPAAAGSIERVTAEGLTVRLKVGDDAQVLGFPQQAAPGAPEWCEATGMASGTVISDEAVAQTQLVLSKVSSPEGGGQMMIGGTLEGAPIWGAVVQVPPQITLVRATYPGREPDEMEPVDGVAVVALTAPVPADAAGVPNVVGQFGLGIDLRQATIEFVAGNGGRTTLDVETDLVGPPIWTDQRCWGQGVVDGTIPPPEPPELPDPGEQPADAEAAEAAVRAALDDLFSAPVEEGREFFDLLDDASGIDLGVAAQMENHADLETLLTKGDVTITDLVFISPIEAFYFYDLETPLAPVINRFGRARVVDGVWKITRGTFCQEILNYGVFCGV